jgi:hypothetical protein
MWAFFLSIQLIVCWIHFKVPLSINVELFLNYIKDTIELNALPKKQVKKYFTDRVALKKVYESGGLLVLIVVPLVIVLTGIVLLLVKCCKGNSAVKGAHDV